MRHQCHKCGLYKLNTQMKRIQQKNKLPLYECKDCDNLMCNHWRNPSFKPYFNKQGY